MKILFIHPVVKEKLLTMDTDYLKDLVDPEENRIGWREIRYEKQNQF